MQIPKNDHAMQNKLNLHQIAILYLIAFNAFEKPWDNQEQQNAALTPLDELLVENGERAATIYCPDEDGAPINGSIAAYNAYNQYILGDEHDFEKDQEFLHAYLNHPNPTKELVLSLIKDFSE